LLASRWLPQNDPLRAGCGPEGPPAPRTHAQACKEAKESDACPYHTWKYKNHPRYKTGINHWSPLSVLNKFDMIWDFCPDMMHIIKTFFERLLIGVFSGSRKPVFKRKEPVVPGTPATAKKRGTPATAEETKEYQGKKRKYDERKVEFEEAILAFDECIFDGDAQKIVDERVKNLVGYPNWIKASLVQSTQYIIGFIQKLYIF
jgi:hypothetical protein